MTASKSLWTFFICVPFVPNIKFPRGAACSCLTRFTIDVIWFRNQYRARRFSFLYAFPAKELWTQGYCWLVTLSSAVIQKRDTFRSDRSHNWQCDSHAVWQHRFGKLCLKFRGIWLWSTCWCLFFKVHRSSWQDISWYSALKDGVQHTQNVHKIFKYICIYCISYPFKSTVPRAIL